MIVPEPNPNSPTWPTVLAFAKLMEHKLSLNRHKGDRDGWMKADFWDLHEAILEETQELFKALDSAPTGMWNGNVILEAADVANFAMMCADSATKGQLLDTRNSECEEAQP